MKHLY